MRSAVLLLPDPPRPVLRSIHQITQHFSAHVHWRAMRSAWSPTIHACAQSPTLHAYFLHWRAMRSAWSPMIHACAQSPTLHAYFCWRAMRSALQPWQRLCKLW